MKRSNLQKQRGIAVITLVLLVIILLSVLGAVVATSRTTSSSTSDQTAKLMASAIVDEGNMLRIGFDLLMAQGIDIASITFNAKQPSSTNGPGLFNAKNGTAMEQLPPTGATGPAGKWLYARGGPQAATSTTPGKTGVKLPLVLTNGKAADANSYAVLLTEVTDAACKQINHSLRGYNANTNIPVVVAAKPSAVTPGADGVADPKYNTITAAFDISDIKFDTTGYEVKDLADATVTGLSGYSICVKPGGLATLIDGNVFVNIVKVEP